MKNSIIYLDNAATTYPKPASVTGAAYECMKKYCGNPSRGSNPLAMRCAEEVFDCRVRLSKLFGCSPERVVFTHNTTYALNMAIKGVTRLGDHILISNMEHNATLRPVADLQRDGIIEYDTYSAYGVTDDELLSDIEGKLRANTRAICAIHMSNICSHTLPISKIGKLCRERGIIFICDGAQSAGHLDINMKRDCIDVLCLPAHKGLYGTQGLGMMLLGDGVSLDTLIEGGNGVNSLDYFMGDVSPERYEAGTLNTPAIVALRHGVDLICTRTQERIYEHERNLFLSARQMLSEIPSVKLYDSSVGPTLLFNIGDHPSDEVGDYLSRHGVCVRTGFHCAPLAHRALGTGASGAVRASFGIFNTQSHIEQLASLCQEFSRYHQT